MSWGLSFDSFKIHKHFVFFLVLESRLKTTHSVPCAEVSLDGKIIAGEGYHPTFRKREATVFLL